AGLRARLVHRREVVDLDAVTRDALHAGKRRRLRLEVGAMPRGGRDTLPHFRLARDVALGAHRRGDLGVRTDRRRPLGDPQIQLAQVRVHALLVAIVAGELRVLALREPLVGLAHHVTTGAEPVVVLHEVVAVTAADGGAEYHDAAAD